MNNTNWMRAIGYFIAFVVGFFVLRFLLAFLVLPLEGALSDVALSAVFWVIQGIVALIAAWQVWKKSSQADGIVVILAFLASLLVGPMNS